MGEQFIFSSNSGCWGDFKEWNEWLSSAELTYLNSYRNIIYLFCHLPSLQSKAMPNVGDDQAECQGGVKFVISLKSFCTHKRSKSGPSWIPLILIYRLFHLTFSRSDFCREHLHTVNLYTLEVSGLLISWIWHPSPPQSEKPILPEELEEVLLHLPIL